MLNVIIEINHEDQTFDIKWILNRDAILEVGKNYCSCCYYRLNSKKSKVEKIMDILFAEEAVKIPPHEKSIKDGIAECYSLFLKNELDFNIVVSKEFINDSIPIKGITLKEKHIIVEELSDEVLEEKNKELLKEIREAFNGISKDNTTVYRAVGSNEVKDVGDDKFSLGNFRKMFEIMTSKVKFTRQDLFNEDGSRKSVYELIQKSGAIDKEEEKPDYKFANLEDMLKEMFGQPLSEKSRRGNYSRGVEIGKGGNVEPILDRIKRNDDLVKNSKPKNESISEELDKLIKFMQTPNPVFERFKAVNELLGTLNVLEKSNNDVDDLLEEVFGKSIKLDKTEMLKKIMDHCRKMFDGTEAIGKPIKDVEDGGCSKLNPTATTLERVRKTATYDMSKNGKPMYSITLNKAIYLFNNIEIYYLGHGDTFKKYYLNLNNGIPTSNISIKELESILLSSRFSNIIDFNQQRYLFDTEFKMPGMYKVIPDIVLLMGDYVPTDFPSPEKLIKDVTVTNFYNLVNPSVFTDLNFRKGMKNRTSSLLSSFDPFQNIKPGSAVFEQKICYVDYVNNMFTADNKRIEGQELYRISLGNEMLLLTEVNDYLRNLIGTNDTIFVLTKKACTRLKANILFQELKFEVCKFIGEGDNGPKVNVSQKPSSDNILKTSYYIDVKNGEVIYSQEKFVSVSGYYVVNPIASKANSQLTNYLRGLIKDGLNNIFPSTFFMTLAATLYFTNGYSNPELVFELVKEDKTNGVESDYLNIWEPTKEKEFLYLAVFQNKLKASLGSTLNKQSKKMLYKISDDNKTSNIKKLSTWINAMHQGDDKEYSYKDILITASALKKLRQEEAFEEMNFEEVEEVK